MGWLKKAGQIILKVTEILVGFGPLASALIPGDKDDKVISVVTTELTQIAGIVTQVEAMAGALSQPLPGDQKLLMATPMVAQILLQSSVMVHHQIHDPVLFQKGCASIASGMADVLNSLRDDVQTITKA
jgi:hypothetical protein